MTQNSLPNEASIPQRRGYGFYLRRGLKWFSILLITLIVLGVGYQTLATELDKRAFTPRGELYTVNGHQMHMVCMGTGSPTVILQAGAVAESLWWYRIQQQMAEHTRICAYDRPGMGWSEPTTAPRDALSLVTELHMLLEVADIQPPYVVVGHSFGAILTRIFAAQYPQEVVGIVLVDSQPVSPKQFATSSEFDQWKQFYDVIMPPYKAALYVGVLRLSQYGQFGDSGYPVELVPELVALQARPQVLDAYYAENFPVFPALQQASAMAEKLGDTPMIVLWAEATSAVFLTEEAKANFQAMQAEIAAYSSNSLTRTITGANHGSILGSVLYAPQVSTAILEVMNAIATHTPLSQ